MSDRVRLLLDDGTVLAEGVRPRVVSLELVDGEWQEMKLVEPWPLPAEPVDAFELSMRHIGERMHQLYYGGFNAVIKL